MSPIKIGYIFLLLSCFIGSCQDNIISKNWLRTGIVYGFSSQNTYINQDSDYTYVCQIYKFSNHFNVSKKEKYSWEILVDPSYYRSEHESLNYWHKFYTDNLTNPDEFRARDMQIKTINEYVLNLGIIFRYNLIPNGSLYAMGNVGPMYIDTDTERMKKGFAFSDIFGIGTNYKLGKLSVDIKTMIRHVSNANLQYPNFGYNAVGFEFGAYYEFK